MELKKNSSNGQWNVSCRILNYRQIIGIYFTYHNCLDEYLQSNRYDKGFDFYVWANSAKLIFSDRGYQFTLNITNI